MSGKRHGRGGSGESSAALVEAFRPLVVSICRRYLREPADLEDAVQTTFGKMVRHVEAVQAGPAAWLTAAAHSTCVDLIRGTMRERRRRAGLAGELREKEAEISATARLLQLDAALRELDDSSRELIVERFLSRTPLRVIAGREGKSVATVSRRVSGVLDELKLVMGIEEAEGLEHGMPGCDESLRFATDWQAVACSGGIGSAAAGGHRPGWKRRIRVGALVSHIAGITASTEGFHYPVESQLLWAKFFGEAGFDLVGVVEPETSGVGHIERAVREFELNAGLIDGTDKAALATLDVIVIPPMFAVRRDVLEAVAEVVAGGVGLYNQWWKGVFAEREMDPVILRLMLSATPIGVYHTPECHGWPIPATVREGHPVIAGLGVGTAMLIPGCGPLYRAVEGARVLITKDVMAESAGTRESGAMRMPVLIAGQIGMGRVVVDHKGFVPQGVLGAGFTRDLLEWLAAPRREEGEG